MTKTSPQLGQEDRPCPLAALPGAVDFTLWFWNEVTCHEPTLDIGSVYLLGRGLRLNWTGDCGWRGVRGNSLGIQTPRGDRRKRRRPVRALVFGRLLRQLAAGRGANDRRAYLAPCHGHAVPRVGTAAATVTKCGNPSIEYDEMLPKPAGASSKTTCGHPGRISHRARKASVDGADDEGAQPDDGRIDGSESAENIFTLGRAVSGGLLGRCRENCYSGTTLMGRKVRGSPMRRSKSRKISPRYCTFLATGAGLVRLVSAAVPLIQQRCVSF